MKKSPRYQYLGWIIEKSLTGWAVLDWDYESESLAYIAKSERAAQVWCEARS
jgi:phage gp46-like protein